MDRDGDEVKFRKDITGKTGWEGDLNRRWFLERSDIFENWRNSLLFLSLNQENARGI